MSLANVTELPPVRESSAITGQSAPQNVQRQVVPINTYATLKSHYEASQKKCAHLKKTYKKYSEKVVDTTSELDILKMEMLDKNIYLAKLISQINEKDARYEELLAEHTNARNKLQFVANNSWLVRTIDRLQAKLTEKIELTILPKAWAYLKNLKRTLLKEKEISLSQVEQPKAEWYSLQRVMPIATGMYRVSDGKEVKYAYFDNNKHQFRNHRISPRYWQPV